MTGTTKLLSEAETWANLDTILSAPTFQRSPTTPADVERFRKTGALIYTVLAEPVEDKEKLPVWMPQEAFTTPGPVLVPRAQLLCQLFGPKGYAQFMAGEPDAALTPWQAGDEKAYAFPAIVNSAARNGMAKLVIAFSERLEDHPAFPVLEDLVWYTRTVKGQALNDYFHATPTGQTLKRTRPGEAEQTMPIYKLHVENWKQQLDQMVSRLMGFEDQFTDELTQLHLKLLGNRTQ